MSNASGQGSAQNDGGDLESVLFVCTANVCRSPMAAALARRLAGAAGTHVKFTSAGILPRGGRSADENAVVLMKEQGMDISEHSSVPVGRALEPLPDVVVTMTRQHCRAVIEQRPEVFERTFPLKDLVRRAMATGPRGAGEPLSHYMRRVGRGRTLSDLVGEVAGDDVRDPLGGGPKAFAACARELENLLLQMAEMLWGESPRSSPDQG